MLDFLLQARFHTGLLKDGRDDFVLYDGFLVLRSFGDPQYLIKALRDNGYARIDRVLTGRFEDEVADELESEVVESVFLG